MRISLLGVMKSAATAEESARVSTSAFDAGRLPGHPRLA
jgi:hypothetical protein